jgi:phage major head subunit gpT-like protein
MAQLITTPTELRQNVNILFATEMAKQRAPFTADISTVVTSSAAKEMFPYIGDAPQLVDFSDEVEFHPMSKTTYEVESGEFAVAVGIRRTEVEDDMYGSIVQRIRQMATVASRYSEKLMVNALEANGTGYDGVALFYSGHPVRGEEGVTPGAGVQDNLLATSGTSTANIQTDLDAALTVLGTNKAENGEPYCEGFGEIFIAAPWALRRSIKEAVGAAEIGGTTNVVYNDLRVQLIFSGRFSSSTAWYVGVKDVATRGMIFVDRLSPSFSALEEGSSNAFTLSQYWYETRMRGKAAPGKWQAIVKVA